MVGLLKIRGEIDLAQFWPAGESDADTTKIKIKVGANSFKFAADGKTFKVTHALDGAKVVGASHKELIDTHGRVTIRLQGVDAPELHYQGGPLSKKRPEVTPEKRDAYNKANKIKRRQYWAETATVALANKLSHYADGGMVECEFWSFVDVPYEISDTYGRLVGNIGVGAGFDTDINLWLAEEGWVFPTFYSSMSEDEIEAVLKAYAAGKKKKRVAKSLNAHTDQFDPDLVYRLHGEIDAAADVGPVLMPKLFRRQVAHAMEQKAKLKPGTFKKFLESKPDECFETKDFLDNGVHSAVTRTLDEFLTGQKFTASPEDLVFKEKAASVVDANNKRVEKF